jgi:hypothetical protein
MFLAAALEGLELQKTRIEEQIRQVKSMLGKRGAAAVGATPPAPVAAKRARRKKRVLSDEARERIAAGQTSAGQLFGRSRRLRRRPIRLERRLDQISQL